MHKSYFFPVIYFLIILFSVNSYAQWDDFEKLTDIGYSFKENLITASTKDETSNTSDPIPTVLKSIDLIANSNGILPSPRFIYKGEIIGYEEMIKNPEWFTGMIDSASLSSVSPDDDGQFYVSQAPTVNIGNMIFHVPYIKFPQIEMRFGEDDEGLAIDFLTFPYKVVQVPFSVWDTRGTPNDTSDDIRLLVTVASVEAHDTTGRWGIRDSVVSAWTANPAKQSDRIYIYNWFEKDYADLVAAWEYQNQTGVPDSTLNTFLKGGSLLRRITINSLDANPLVTVNSITGLKRPKKGTVIRWSFEVGLKVTAYNIYAVVGKEVTKKITVAGFPQPQCQLISGPPGMYLDSENIIHWTPGINDVGSFEYTISATNYRGTVESSATVWVDPLPPDYKNHENKLKVSVLNNGILGGYAPGQSNSATIGDGISFKNKNGLFTGGLIIALSKDTIAGRAAMQKQAGNDFMPLTLVTPIDSPIPNFEQAYSARYNDKRFNREKGKIGLTITQNSYSSKLSPINGFVIFDYRVHNDNDYDLDSLFFGIFTDFDIVNYRENLTGFDSARKMAYVYNPNAADSSYYYGIIVLKGEVSGFTEDVYMLDYPRGLYDKLTVIDEPSPDLGDKNMLLTSGPYNVQADKSFRVVYAVVAGEDLSEIQANADYARQVDLNFESTLVTFQVDMSVQEQIGAFQPDSGDMVVVRGSFNNWEETNKYSLKKDEGSGIYQLPIMINKPDGENIDYKFLIVSPDGAEKWEEDPALEYPSEFMRRVTLNGESITLPPVLFSDETITMVDSLALVDLYKWTNGTDWTNKDNWLSDQPLSAWYGVTVRDGRVVELNLENNDLNGELSGTLGNLTALEKLILNNNKISLSVTDDLYNLHNLRELRLNDNMFYGKLSEKIGKLTNLRILTLQKNELNGSLPAALGSLGNLEVLDLSGNSFSGEWPDQLLNLSKLTFLSIADNNFEGAVPETIGNLNKLNDLYINGNSFAGVLPGRLNDLINLERLGVYENQFDTMPQLGALSKLKKLWMQKNRFTFEDIEPNLNIPADTIVYAPQDSVGMAVDTLVEERSGFTMSVSVGGEHNLYQWYKGDEEIAGATDPAYTITVISQNDQGAYHCKITNSAATDLTLFSRPINLHIKSIPIIGSEGEANDVRATYCRLSAHVLPNGNEVNVKFKYGENSVNENEITYHNNPVPASADGTDVFAELTGLKPATTYHWQVVLSYGNKTISGNELTFKTLALPGTIPVKGSVSFPVHESPSDYAPEDYRLIGLPGNGADISLSEIMPGEFNKDWTAYWDNGAQNNYLIKFNNSDVFKLVQGRAFWVISKNAIDVNLSMPQAEFDNKDAAQIALHEGWNIITNPANVTVSWNDIKRESGIGSSSEALWQFNGSWEALDRMEPKKGYYFFNSSNLQALKVPLKPMTSMKKTSVLNDTLFTTISLSLNNRADEDKIFFVVNDDVENFRMHKPRTIAGMNGIYYLKPDWDESYPAFMTDVRKSGERLYDVPFFVSIASSKKGALHFRGIDNIDENSEVYLVDLGTATYQNLRENDSYSFTVYSKKRSFKLLIGEIEKIENELQKIVPKEFVLENNYPNPFNPETVIPLKIPQESVVELSIYNILGEKINTLYNGTLNAGRHLFKWNGRSTGGALMPSGVYFYRMQVQGGMRLTKKMILMR